MTCVATLSLLMTFKRLSLVLRSVFSFQINSLELFELIMFSSSSIFSAFDCKTSSWALLSSSRKCVKNTPEISNQKGTETISSTLNSLLKGTANMSYLINAAFKACFDGSCRLDLKVYYFVIWMLVYVVFQPIFSSIIYYSKLLFNSRLWFL